MAHQKATFRLFVSSTFSDFVKEREALHAKVFPRLKAVCGQYDCDFLAIDLRWGISEEATRDHRTMSICLEELSRCQRITPKPNFLVLLGNRYGWRPLPARIPAEEFNELVSHIDHPDDRALLLGDPFQPERVAGWYRKDENSVPPEYALRPRSLGLVSRSSGSPSETEREAEQHAWEQIELRLGSALRRAVTASGWDENDPRRFQYEASATHQEILHDALSSTMGDNAVCFLRELEGIPVGTDASLYVDTDPDSRSRLEALKAELRKRLGGNCVEYHVPWVATGPSQEHLDTLCADTYARLEAIILAEIRRRQNIDELQEEIEAHLSYGKSMSRVFAGREEIKRQIHDHLRGQRRILALTGGPGSGRSALLAVGECESRKTEHAVVVTRFVGATQDSFNADALVRSLSAELANAFGEPQAIDVNRPAGTAPALLELLKRATPDRPIWICVDDIDRLVDELSLARFLVLLMDSPEHVRWVVTCRKGQVQEAIVVAAQQGIATVVECDQLSAEDRVAVLDVWLADASRTLQPSQRQRVLAAAHQATVLSLVLLFEVSRRWDSSYQTCDGELADEATNLLKRDINRLSESHGPVLLSRALGYLKVSEHGLSEPELLDALDRDAEVRTEFLQRSPRSPHIEGLPTIIWSRLAHDLLPYLRERWHSGRRLLALSSSTIDFVVAESFLLDTNAPELHAALSNYFETIPLQFDPANPDTRTRRIVSELLWNLFHSKSCDPLAERLIDLQFFEVAWRYKQRLIRPAWYRVEKESTHRMVESYAPAMHGPVTEQAVLPLLCVVQCLAAFGHQKESMELLTRLIEACQKIGDVALVVIVLAVQLTLLAEQRDDQQVEKVTGLLVDVLRNPSTKDSPIIQAKLDKLVDRLGNDLVRVVLQGITTNSSAGCPQSINLLHQAYDYVVQEEMQKAYDIAKAASFAAMEENNPGVLTDAEALIGRVYMLTGKTEEAAEHLKRAQDWYVALCDDDGLARVLIDQVHVHLDRGDPESAKAAAEELERIARFKGSVYLEAVSAYCLALVLLPTNPIRALRYGRQARRLAAAKHYDLLEQADETIAQARQRCAELEADANDPLSRLAVGECEMRDCDGAGRFTKDHIVWVGPPSTAVVGWCSHCECRVCTMCAIQRYAAQDQFLALPLTTPIRQLCLNLGQYPSTPTCPACSTPLGVGDNELFIHVPGSKQ